jgi:hypothetical protein
MSADEGFLARWSRRKRDAAYRAQDLARPKKSAPVGASEPAAASVPPKHGESPFDPASLPPIEAIGAGSDISAFLAAGVPATLTRTALRRAWSVDPAIRDFIGLSENSWDFNAPGGVPGFGPVTAEEVCRLLAQAPGEPDPANAARPVAGRVPDGHAAPVGESEPAASDRTQDADRTQEERAAAADHGASQLIADANDIAIQHALGECECFLRLPQRRHGSAVPE